ncbi:hypothetical protein D3H64_04855 [Atopobacter sp. AH10]|uniref:hypothetical protein n=1 Tax=Atopobacter sp. AH10 TaxID=2315861 RepID=UPI000EF27179|nr:hypothetical protein [Atopobacter sp. AH10]RLK63314.1 hypothetical protein D3H64_04855 [Atopobacter sp. AH10]
MKKCKLIYLVFASYLTSFLLLVFEYINSHTTLKLQLNFVQKELGISSTKLSLLVFLIATIYSIIALLLYYKVGEFFALKCDNIKNYNSEQLIVSIMISETVCYVTSLFLIRHIDINSIRLIIPTLGLIILATLLNKKYSFKFVLTVLLVRFLFYLSNLLVVV